jgi:hypothetical protein
MSGGIETVTEAYDTSSAGLLLNISPAPAVERLRVVTTSTGTSDIPSPSTCATGTNSPCASRPLHPLQQIAEAKAVAVSKRILQIKTITRGPNPSQGVTLFDTAQLAGADATACAVPISRHFEGSPVYPPHCTTSAFSRPDALVRGNPFTGDGDDRPTSHFPKGSTFFDRAGGAVSPFLVTITLAVVPFAVHTDCVVFFIASTVAPQAPGKHAFRTPP